ncbi:MAG: hypothetical protein ACI9RO_000098 [Alteromonas macleodii]|jgi:hypothetical protein
MKIILCFGVIVALTACAGSGSGLRDLRSNGGGPDEFRVMPAGALVLPDNVTTLPEPTPGQSNRTDPSPDADAVAVLGGNPNVLIPNGIPASDGALMSVVRRNGVDPSIRQTLATEDAGFRLSQTRFGFSRGRNRYFSAYASQALDAYSELWRFRNAGVATPSAPPQ